MKVIALISALALIGSAAALPAAAEDVNAATNFEEVEIETRSDKNEAFTLIALRSASPIQFAEINADGEKFILGGEPSSYCPEPKKQCPPGNVTAFLGGNGALAMDVEVPGGQLVYVEKNGAVGYTQAHSASIPKGATTGGWTREKVKGASYELVSHKGGLFACKQGKDGYQMFAGVEGFKKKGCLGFEAAASPYKGFGAWQY